MLSAYTYFLFNVVGDNVEGLEIARQAVERAPSVLENRLTYIKLLIVMQQFAEASKQITTLEKLDRFGAYAREIEIRKGALSTAMKAAAK